jgi:hypothetical protein
MEMPEGWWKLYKKNLTFTQTGSVRNVSLENNTLDLIKEMAEALELQSQWTTLTDEGYAILKKFKEWK